MCIPREKTVSHPVTPRVEPLFVLIPSVLFRQEGLSSFGERLLAPDFESRLTCHTGENAFARHAGSGKGAVIDFPGSTGRRAGLEDRRCAAVFQRQPQSFLRPTGKGTGHIRSVFGDDTPAPDFRGKPRGVGSPPRTSGHTGRACPVRTSACTAGQGEQPPSYRQDSPARHALTTYRLDMFGSILTPSYSNRIHVPARRRGGRSAPERRDWPFQNPQNQIAGATVQPTSAKSEPSAGVAPNQQPPGTVYWRYWPLSTSCPKRISSAVPSGLTIASRRGAPR